MRRSFPPRLPNSTVHVVMYYYSYNMCGPTPPRSFLHRSCFDSLILVPTQVHPTFPPLRSIHLQIFSAGNGRAECCVYVIQRTYHLNLIPKAYNMCAAVCGVRSRVTRHASRGIIIELIITNCITQRSSLLNQKIKK